MILNDQELKAAQERITYFQGLLAQLRTKSRPGLGWIKSVTHRGRELPLRDGVALEGLSFMQYVASSDHPRQGLEAFKKKRQPEF